MSPIESLRILKRDYFLHQSDESRCYQMMTSCYLPVQVLANPAVFHGVRSRSMSKSKSKPGVLAPYVNTHKYIQRQA